MKKINLNDPKVFIIGIILLLSLFFVGKKATDIFLSEPPLPKEFWQQNYRQELLNNNIDLKYTQAQSTIDYVTPELQEVINEMESTSPEDAIKKATRYVLRNVRYESAGITIDFCKKETATSTLLAGFGDCVSMVKLGTAILRGQGIAVRTLGGCVDFSGRCSTLMGVVPIPYQKSDIQDGKKRGFLHEWTEVWIPNKGWILVDFTNGGIYEKGCEDYTIYAYDEANYYNMCVIEDSEFNKMCYEN